MRECNTNPVSKWREKKLKLNSKTDGKLLRRVYMTINILQTQISNDEINFSIMENINLTEKHTRKEYFLV